jgi:hypothetical protein
VETLKWSDQRKISTFVRDLYTLDSVKAISERVVQKLNTFIGATNILVPVVDIKTKTISLMADTVGPELHKLLPVVSTLQHEHPAIKYHRVHANDRAVTIGDLLPLYQRPSIRLQSSTLAWKSCVDPNQIDKTFSGLSNDNFS